MSNSDTQLGSTGPPVGDRAILRLRLGRSQYALLAVLVALVAVIATVGYRAAQEVNDQTGALGTHLQTANNDRVSLQREVIKYALVAERWSEANATTEDLELSRALVERQRLVALDEGALDLPLGQALTALSELLNNADAITGRPADSLGTTERQDLSSTLDAAVTLVNQIYVRTEKATIDLVYQLDADLERSQQTEFIVAGLIVLLIAVLMLSLQRMLANNFDAASSLIRKEQARSGIARAEKDRAEYLSAAQTEILEMVAHDTPMLDVLDRIVELMAPHAAEVRLQFSTAGHPADPQATDSVRLTDLSGGDSIGALEWTIADGAELPPDFDALLRLAARLGSLAIDRQIAADQMAFQATHDSLTGLPNRVLLVERIQSAIGRARANDTELALLFLDVDRFKVVNDSLGHEAGDHLVVQLADRLAEMMRSSDTVGRFGGDEFVILLEAVGSLENVCQTATRVLELIARPVELDGNLVHVSTSIGIVRGDGSSTTQELLKNADVAMYRAKNTGRNRYAIFDQAMQDWAANRHSTEIALRLAPDRGEFDVFYQPFVDLASMRFTGFEALVRWNRPGFGLVSPDQFIELAEELGIVGRIGEFVLERATAVLAEWRAVDPELTMSVNVSGRDLPRKGFVESVSRALENAHAPADGLILEITESVLLDDAEEISRQLSALRDLGVRIAIDDFGTGYSSLRYLREFPVDILKIDRAFVSAGGPELEDPTIVASVTDLGHALGLAIVAEGVETPAQLDAMRNLGVDGSQGYLFGRPGPADDLRQVVGHRWTEGSVQEDSART